MREEVQKEVVELSNKVDRGTFDISMRLGKTLCGLSIAQNYSKVLVAYPNNSIKESWLSDSIKFEKDVNHIDFTTFNSFTKHNLNDYNCVIIDEIQLFSITNAEYLINNLPNKLFCFTGTLPTNGDKRYYIDKYYPVIYEKKITETTGFTNSDYEVYIHLLNPSIEKDILLKSGKYWSEKQKISFFEGKYEKTRNFMMMLQLIKAISNSTTKFNYLQKLVNNLQRGIVFVETIEQCNKLNLPSYHSKEKNSEIHLQQFNSLEINKLATISQLKAGITFPDLEEVIILHSYSSNDKAMQKLGRALNFKENKIAKIHILCLKDTRDEQWVKNSIKDLDQNKIKYVYT